MRALELRIEDYERRLKTMTATISEQKDKETINRWRTKMSCYHTFISELNRAKADAASTESKLNLAGVNYLLPHYFEASESDNSFCKCGKYLTDDCHKRQL